MNRRYAFKMVEDRHELATRFQVGDIVAVFFLPDGHFTGEVVGIDPVLGKVFVSFGGRVTQMDPEEIRVCDLQKVEEVSQAASVTASRPTRVAGKMISAIYHCDLGRKYKLTRSEQDNGVANCPRCYVEMEKEPFARGVYLYRCPECSFKITTDDLYEADFRKDEEEGQGPVMPQPMMSELVAKRLVRSMMNFHE